MLAWRVSCEQASASTTLTWWGPELRASRSAMCPTTVPTKWQIMPWLYSYGAYVAYALPRPPQLLQLHGGVRPALPPFCACRNAPWACSALVVLDRRPPGGRNASASTCAGTIPTCHVDRIRSHVRPAWRTCP